ncbi:MAG TPA: hypothetical protein VKA46_27070 [Gemmataceae bacterium]|nr:hypothetical protein [Gemmataceae bacterium]
MTTLRGHFDEQHIVLDQPPPADLKPHTPVEVVVLKSREELVREFLESMKALWDRPLPPGFKPTGRRWRREELYERGGKPLA